MWRKDAGNVSKSVKIATTNLKWVPTAIAQTSHIKREKEGKRSKERKKTHIETTEIQRKRSKIAQVSGKDTQQVANPVETWGFEPRTPAWQARILPLNNQCSPLEALKIANTSFLVSIGTYLSLPYRVFLFRRLKMKYIYLIRYI